jgi:uncharacterized protein (UPF0332 family)
LRSEHVSELVSLRLKQAREILADARALLDTGRTPRSVVNRAYYAMFYKEFVHSGAFPTEMSRSLHRAFDERHESDYETVKTATRVDAIELLDEAEQFVQRVAEFLKTSAAK